MENNIYLIWMPWSGKSTIGKQLATKLSKNFLDFDDLLEKTANMTVGQLLTELWENMFAGYEKNLALSLEYSNTVISLSWSVSLIDEVMTFLKKSGPVIYINTPIDTIKKRLPQMKTDRIVGLNESTIDQIFQQRKPQYEKWADYTFDNLQDASPEEVFKNFEIFLSKLPAESHINKVSTNTFYWADANLYSKYKVAWDFMYVSWQIGMILETQEMITTSIQEEFAQAFRNTKIILLWAWFGPKDVVKTTIYMKNLEHYDIMNEIFSDYFVIKPARSVVQVADLPLCANIMIEVVAYKDMDGKISAKRDWGPWRGI